ncbi:MAG: phosphatase PAP2 family protein [Anaerolineae bacterium]|nr:phosphatase PAP2 family protein [Anaerolineae bacterium]
MQVLWQTEIVINLFFQSLGTGLLPVMKFFSYLGQEEVYILIVPILYWCVDLDLALRFIFVLLASAYSNAILKITFHGARPYWLDKNVLPLSSEKSFGIPSGHAQNAASIWGVMACYSKKIFFKILFILLIFFIGLSRIYLGVHFTSDVIAGWILGGLLLWLVLKLEPAFRSWFDTKSMNFQLSFFCAISFCMLFAGLLWLNIQSRVPLPEVWLQNTAAYSDIQPVSPYLPNDIVSFSGIFLGIMLGYTWVKHHMPYNPASGSIQQKSTRLLVGLVGLIIIVYGFGPIFPFSTSPDVAGLVSRYFRYAIHGIWLTGLAPLLFGKLKLI